MPKKLSEKELKPILSVLAKHPESLSVSEIHDLLEGRIPRRTLQRRLMNLVESDELTSSGQGPARRYRLTSKTVTEKKQEKIDPWEISIPLSGDAREIRDLVKRPKTQRHPVSYQEWLLEDYQPNDTFYLRESVRAHLLNIGKPNDEIQPAGTYARNLYQRLLVDLTWNSSRLEGNTYSLLETERLLQQGLAADEKDAMETQMILNHKSAIDLLIDSAQDIAFNTYTICNLHALLSENLLSDPSACGRVRSIGIEIGGSVYFPIDNPPFLQATFQSLLGKAQAINNPFEQAFFVMVHLPYLQPFEDVNKRVSRLAANIPLIQKNLCPLSFIDVPKDEYIDALLGVYELTRIEYLHDVFIWAYEHSCSRYSAIRQTIGEPDPFKLHYRQVILETVNQIVKDKLDHRQTISKISKDANDNIPDKDRNRFIEVVETELRSLHMGNIARYHIRPAEFESWQKNWVFE